MKYETRLIWVLTITFGFVFFDRNAASFLMPFIANDLHFNNSQVGLVASALSFTWAVAAFLGGAYSDRTGNRKSFLLITVVAFSLCSFASGLAVSFVTLFSTRLLMGLAEGPDTADRPVAGGNRIHRRQARQQHGGDAELRQQSARARSWRRSSWLPSRRPSTGAGLSIWRACRVSSWRCSLPNSCAEPATRRIMPARPAVHDRRAARRGGHGLSGHAAA